MEDSSRIILAAISLLDDLGYDFKKNSALNLIGSVQELLLLCQTNDDLREDLKNAMKDIDERNKKRLS